MDLTAIIAALPWLRKLWRWLPGPLRVPLLVAAAAIWLYRRVRGRDDDGVADDGAQGDGPPGDGVTDEGDEVA